MKDGHYHFTEPASIIDQLLDRNIQDTLLQEQEDWPLYLGLSLSQVAQVNQPRVLIGKHLTAEHKFFHVILSQH